jgi:hypothetical protein
VVPYLVVKVLHLINIVNIRLFAYQRQVQPELLFLGVFFQSVPVIFPAELAV